MVRIFLMLLLASAVASDKSTKSSDCYHHEDPAAKYKLCHEKTEQYPTDEITLVLERNPKMKDMFYHDDHPLIAPVRHYSNPPQPICSYERFTLYSFFYANRDCYVIYPDIQRIHYVQCGTQQNRDCQRCSTYGGVSKCVEDYDYTYVWAYCIQQPLIEIKPIEPIILNSDRQAPQPQYKPTIDRQDSYNVDPYPQVYYEYYEPQPSRSLSVERKSLPADRRRLPADRIRQPVDRNHPRDSVRYSTGSDYVDPRHPYPKMYKSPWNKVYRPYILNHRWKRSYHSTTPVRGQIERLKLYLPHHCGCKNYVC